MIFTPTAIEGAYQIDIDPIVDDRGYFARTWCREEFLDHGLIAELCQTSVAWSDVKGTLRGLHYLAPPHVEAKLVRCTRGASFVVIADIRPGSATFGKWLGIELTADNHRQLYMPPGCAQGYQTLADKTEMLYQMSTAFVPGATRGVRYDDPFFQINWPLQVTAISAADRTWPLMASAEVNPSRPTCAVQLSQ
jgi:dTDP-4-dehydrorhamnose 3,5-epimerase